MRHFMSSQITFQNPNGGRLEMASWFRVPGGRGETSETVILVPGAFCMMVLPIAFLAIT